ncbi:hypothetical protein D3C86_1163020 [compost metagenome]
MLNDVSDLIVPAGIVIANIPPGTSIEPPDGPIVFWISVFGSGMPWSVTNGSLLRVSPGLSGLPFLHEVNVMAMISIAKVFKYNLINQLISYTNLSRNIIGYE